MLARYIERRSMNKLCVVAFAMVVECVWAQCQYMEQLTNMVSALRRQRGTLDVSFTNQLSICMEGETNEFHKANVAIVSAISFADIAEAKLCGDVLLPRSISICSNLLMSSALPSDAWQKGAASIVLAGVYSFDGQYRLARNAATNHLFQTEYGIDSEEDRALWGAISSHLDVDGLSVYDAKRCYAALASIMDGAMCDVSSFTNGLPESVLAKIRDIAR